MVSGIKWIIPSIRKRQFLSRIRGFLLNFQQQEFLFVYLVLGFVCVSLIKEVQIKWMYYMIAANSSPTRKQQEKLSVEIIGKKIYSAICK